jgi:hypothetical protein
MRSSHNPSSERTWPKTFQTAFCEHFGCTPNRYESELLRRGLFRHAVPLACLIRRFKPQFFVEDLDLIREVGKMTSPELFKNEVNYFYGRNLRHKNWLRSAFRIRISGSRMLRIRRRVFP